MTREQAKANLVGLGIAEPTDEAVTNYLNQVNGESQKEKQRADQYKKDADKVKELQDKLAELENANLSDIEKANKAAEEANAKYEELQKKFEMNEKRSEALKHLAGMGITGDEAEGLINENGVISDYEALGKILSEREKAAATKKEQEIANNSTNPNGGDNNNSGNNDKSEAVKMAEAISFGNSAKAEEKDYYKL